MAEPLMPKALAIPRTRVSSRSAGRSPLLGAGRHSLVPSRGLIPLVHTVRRASSTVRPLMRTVLRDTKQTFQGGLVRSPTLAVRASGRSYGLQKRVKRALIGTGFNPVFVVPQLDARALACARRQIRREVILATGRGGGRHRPPSYRSNWRC